MKLNSDQLKSHLQQPLRPVYLLHGDEPLLIQEASDLLRKTARDQGFLEREVLHAESGFQWESLLEKANSLSLFAEKQLIELHIPNGKPGPRGTDILVSYLKSPSPDTLLVIYCPKLDGSSQKSKWAKTVESAGAMITFWPIEVERLPAWIKGRFSQAGMEANPAAVQMLCDRVEGNLLAAIQEIEKLRLIYAGQAITEQEILASVSDSSRYDLFTLMDTALAGDQQRCVKIIQGLRAEGIEPTLVLWALSRDLRTLLNLSLETGGGSVSEPQFKKHRIWGKRKSLVNKALRRNSNTLLSTLLQKCGEVDRAIKGASQQSPWTQLTTILLLLAGCRQPLN
ncbi:MAG: DNA polymerase III subunit delta [Motiliproteus sp.]|nr:DNA polymerase III subunit delta [Motiliproteus sp.]MCW9051521.1 DNA polymerase III subunit delta [Motiliproteus sp.]